LTANRWRIASIDKIEAEKGRESSEMETIPSNMEQTTVNNTRVRNGQQALGRIRMHIQAEHPHRPIYFGVYNGLIEIIIIIIEFLFS
jgi:hypothetical protein